MSRARIIYFLEALIAVLFLGLTVAVVIFHSLTAADNWILAFLYAIRTPALFSFFSYATMLGSPTAVIGILIVSALALFWFKHLRLAAALIIAVVGASVSELLLKVLIERVRPSGFSDLLPTSYSFPSGHATSSMALYGFLTYILYHLFPRYRHIIIPVGFTLVGIVGFSRLYLGVHYPSDILGGYLLATMWIFIAIRAAHVMKK